MKAKAKELKDKAVFEFSMNNKERAKYYLQRMREVSPLH